MSLWHRELGSGLRYRGNSGSLHEGEIGQEQFNYSSRFKVIFPSQVGSYVEWLEDRIKEESGEELRLDE